MNPLMDDKRADERSPLNDSHRRVSYQEDPTATAFTLGILTSDSSPKWGPLRTTIGLAAAVLTLTFFARISWTNNSSSDSTTASIYPYPFTPPNAAHSTKKWTPPGGHRYAEYAPGKSPHAITPEVLQQSDELAKLRGPHVKKACQHVWKGYTTFAFGMDELKPISAQGDNIWQGLATTMVDALDTLWLMDMKEEFWQARDYIRDHLDYSTKNVSVICFETTIRSLAGMLSAYNWSGDAVFLEQALDLAKRVIQSFDGVHTGIPLGRVNLKTGEAYNDHHEDFTYTSWVGTLQLEFRWLDAFVQSEETARMRHQVENIITILHQLDPPQGLYPTMIQNIHTGSDQPQFANAHLSFGANGDSFYEYLLKAWIQGGKQETLYREMYDKAIQGLHDSMMETSTPSGLTYFVDIVDGVKVHKLHHLTCFMGGLLALGAYTDPLGFDSERAQRDLATAKAITYTCYQMYARQKTGLSPEEVEFIPGHDFQLEGQAAILPEGEQADYGTQPGTYTTSSQYIMRPEVVESLYTLHAITKDPVYRDWAWEIFQAIETYSKTPIAYGEFPNVANISATPNDKMESFFLAETLKYIYLLMDPASPVDVLATHVFNTEAHPLPIFAKLPTF